MAQRCTSTFGGCTSFNFCCSGACANKGQEPTSCSCAHSGWPHQLKSSNCPPFLCSSAAREIDEILYLFSSRGKATNVGKTGFVISLSAIFGCSFLLAQCKKSSRECFACRAKVGRSVSVEEDGNQRFSRTGRAQFTLSKTMGHLTIN